MRANRQWPDAVIATGFCLTVGLTGCSSEDGPSQQATMQEGSRSFPPPAPGPNFKNGSAIAIPGTADTQGLSEAQIDAMFDAAVARKQPGESNRAICVGMQGLADGAVMDAPEKTIRRLSELLRLPAFPASRCGADIYPFVAAMEAKAIVYTVKVESRDSREVFTFWATAGSGNLAAGGMQFRLVRQCGRWMPEPTGVSLNS